MPQRKVIVWVCARDQFPVQVDFNSVEASLSAILAHSVTLVGAVNTVVQLDV